MESKKDHVIFNPFFNRLPKGAVEIGRNITLSVTFPEHFNIWDLTLIIENDSGDRVGEIKFTDAVTFQLHEPCLYWYHFTFSDCYGTHFLVSDDNLDAKISDHHANLWQLSVHTPFANVAWFQGKVMYQIMVDRFFKAGTNPIRSDVVMHTSWDENPQHIFADKSTYNNDFFGGDLQGVIAKLPYLKSLNVGVIYLSPIFEAFSNHKYDTGDYFKIDSMFGKEEDFIELCQKAEALGISIILDGVFNHTGDRSVYFNKYATYDSIGAYQSKDSVYFDWYQFTKHPNHYKSWWGITSLPSINQNNPDFLSFIDTVIKRWLRLGAKGYRLDVVDELNNTFVRRIRKAVKESKEDNLLIGEVWEDASNKTAYGVRKAYFDGSQLDSVMNYVWKNAIIDYVKHRNVIGLRNQIRRVKTNYPKQVVDSLMNIVDTHDTIRIMNQFSFHHPNNKDKAAIYQMSEEEIRLAIEKVKMVSILQFMLPGVPCVFYGDEVGLDGFRDPFCRKTFPWHNMNHDLLAWYQRLGNIRKMPVFVDGDYEEIRADKQCFMFARSKGPVKVIVVINHSFQQQEFLISGKNLLTKQRINQLWLSSQAGAIVLVKANN